MFILTRFLLANLPISDSQSNVLGNCSPPIEILNILTLPNLRHRPPTVLLFFRVLHFFWCSIVIINIYIYYSGAGRQYLLPPIAKQISIFFFNWCNRLFLELYHLLKSLPLFVFFIIVADFFAVLFFSNISLFSVRFGCFF
jgi:hypothetical protein